MPEFDKGEDLAAHSFSGGHIEKTAQAVVEHIPLLDIVVNFSRNIREADNYDIEALQSLRRTGLTQPYPFVSARKPNGAIEYHLLCGFRRFRYLLKWHNDDAESFKAMFNDLKVPVLVISDLTVAEEEIILLDHGQYKDLSPWEKRKTVMRLTLKGYSELEVIRHVGQMFGGSKRLGSKSASRYDDAAESGDQDAMLRILAEGYRGQIQPAMRIVRLPQEAQDAFKAAWDRSWKKEGGPGWKLKNSDVNSLSTVFRKECAKNREYTKASPGPKYMKEWTRIVALRIREGSGEIVEGKLKGKKAIENMRGLYSSTHVLDFHDWHLGVKDAGSTIHETDEWCIMLEFLQLHDVEFFATISERHRAMKDTLEQAKQDTLIENLAAVQVKSDTQAADTDQGTPDQRAVRADKSKGAKAKRQAAGAK